MRASSFIIFPLSAPIWQRRTVLILALFAVWSVFMLVLFWWLKLILIAAIIGGSYWEWQRFSHFPIELLVSKKGVAVRLQQNINTTTADSTPSIWRTPILGVIFLAVPSPQGWWLLTHENLSAESMRQIRRLSVF